MRWKNDVINVHDTIPSVDMMYGIHSQVVTRDAFKMPGVSDYVKTHDLRQMLIQGP